MSSTSSASTEKQVQKGKVELTCRVMTEEEMTSSGELGECSLTLSLGNKEAVAMGTPSTPARNLSSRVSIRVVESPVWPLSSDEEEEEKEESVTPQISESGDTFFSAEDDEGAMKNNLVRHTNPPPPSLLLCSCIY